MSETVDAIVIGAGHNGSVAAALLADAGWDVVVLEQQPEPGGAVRSAELSPGYVTDLFSAFYPLSAVSPALRSLGLEDHGLRWSHAPAVFGHARAASDDHAPVVCPDPAATAAGLREYDKQDAETWLRLCDQWQRLRDPLVDSLFGPFPPIRAARRLWRTQGTPEALRLLRFLLLPARRMGRELFRSEAARLLLLGNAMHADVPSDAPGSGVLGYLLTMLAQDTGFPVPVGGAGRLTDALVARAGSAGAEYRCGTAVTDVDVRSGRAVAVRTAGGEHIRARRAIIADVSAPALYTQLVPPDALPARLLQDIEKFEWDTPVLKVNYALAQKIPWRAAALPDAGTIHLGADENGLVRWMADLTTGVIPQVPFTLFGQMTTADPTRSPSGTESAWAYTHLPRGSIDPADATLLATRLDDMLEAHAPGFRDLVVDRFVQTPADLQAADANLPGGAVNGGTAQLHQQLIFRPTPGLSRAETPIDGLYLGSASAHPGGGVHGSCGRSAAIAALKADSAWGRPKRMASKGVRRLVYGTA